MTHCHKTSKGKPNTKCHASARRFLTYVIGSLLILSTICTGTHASAAILINTNVVKKSVVFIYGMNAAGQIDATHPIGTGFLVTVPREDSRGIYLLLVTARHIVDPKWANCPVGDPSEIAVRLNLKAYDPTKGGIGVDFVPIPLRSRLASGATSGRTLYYVATDDQADAAVIQLTPKDFPLEKYDVDAIPISDFATGIEAKDVGTGDQIVSAGLVPGTQGQLRNYPVFKFGRISDKPDEPLFTSCLPGGPQRPEKIWFLSINLFPGASGSPVFYVPPGYNGVAFGAPVTRPVLLGVQSSSDVPADVAEMAPIKFVYNIIQKMALPDANLQRGPKSTASNSKK